MRGALAVLPAAVDLAGGFLDAVRSGEGGFLGVLDNDVSGLAGEAGGVVEGTVDFFSGILVRSAGAEQGCEQEWKEGATGLHGSRGRKRRV